MNDLLKKNISKMIWIFIGKVLWPKAFWWLFCEFSILIQCDLHFDIWVHWEFQFVCWTLTLLRVDFKWNIVEFYVVFADPFNLWATWGDQTTEMVKNFCKPVVCHYQLFTIKNFRINQTQNFYPKNYNNNFKKLNQ